ncbi:MAG: helix-turn-helix domain-containing protein [bacterium]
MDIKNKLAGKLIGKWRTSQKITQESLAKGAGVSRGLITQIETGRKKITESTLYSILKVMFPEKETQKIIKLFWDKIEEEIEERNKLKLEGDIMFADSLIFSKEDLENIGINNINVLITDFLPISAENAVDFKKKEALWEKWERIEKIADKYALKIEDKIYNKFLADEIEIGDEIIIAYYDNYDPKNVKNNGIFAIYNEKTGEKLLAKIKILKFYENNSDDIFYSFAINKNEEVVFKNNLGPFRIKGQIVSVIKRPVCPETKILFF